MYVVLKGDIHNVRYLIKAYSWRYYVASFRSIDIGTGHGILNFTALSF